MKIIIPMSGMGNRFVKAGYTTPKPLIEIDGMPIIEHVVKMFPGETDFIFICNSKHLEETNMRSVLKNIAPQGIIKEIPPHKKGPVHAVLSVKDLIDDEEEVIVNYCDFSVYWNYSDFLSQTRKNNADGAVPSYKGFHPHMLGTTNYAFLRDHNNWMLEIQEKKPFTDNRMQEYASTGTYYFKKGSFVKQYFAELINLDLNLNGEFYVSLVYNLLVRDPLRVWIYEVEHMLQWGTPEDVEEYLEFSNFFRAMAGYKFSSFTEKNSLNLIPMAGLGSRFSKEGYTKPKPMIEVDGKPMVIQATSFLPKAEQYIFVCQQKHLENYPVEKNLKTAYPDAKIIAIDGLTEGQAVTCEMGLKQADDNSPLLIGACDNGMLWNSEKYKSLITDSLVDVIVWTFKGHPAAKRNPEMYGWVATDDQDFITQVSVKKPISKTPENDHAIVGAFYFKKTSYFKKALNALYENNTRVNGEFYVDSLINEALKNNLKAKVFLIDHYIGWGTPNDYKSYLYWKRFFDKTHWHPYKYDR